MWVQTDQGVGRIIDSAYDPKQDVSGYAVQYEGGRVDLVHPSLCSPVPDHTYAMDTAMGELAALALLNPSAGVVRAVGEVELQETGYPNVVALRGEKIPKHRQLSDILGVEVSWDPHRDLGFHFWDGGRVVSLGYSFDDALAQAVAWEMADLSMREIQAISKQAEALKWGELGGGRQYNPYFTSYPLDDFARKIEPFHPVWDKKHKEKIKKSILKQGWVGPPLLVIEYGGDLRALMGAHRIGALLDIAKQYPDHELQVPVAIVSASDDQVLDLLQSRADATEIDEIYDLLEEIDPGSAELLLGEIQKESGEIPDPVFDNPRKKKDTKQLPLFGDYPQLGLFDRPSVPPPPPAPPPSLDPLDRRLLEFAQAASTHFDRIDDKLNILYDREQQGYNVEQAIGAAQREYQAAQSYKTSIERMIDDRALGPEYRMEDQEIINRLKRISLMLPGVEHIKLNPSWRFEFIPDRPGMVIQSVLFPVDWSVEDSMAWLSDHGLDPSAPDYGRTVTRYRQIAPDQIRPGSYSTIPLGTEGIQAIVGIPVEPNPWGMTREGQRVLYARAAGPSGQEQLSLFVDRPVRYFWPGDPQSPDPSRGGYWDGQTYLGASFASAYAALVGIPSQDLERAVISGVAGSIGSYRLRSGDTLLQRIQATGGDVARVLDSLWRGDRENLTDLAIQAGYLGGLGDLITDLVGQLEQWGEIPSEGEGLRFPNPPLYVEVVGPVGRTIAVSVDTTEGKILGSPDFKRLEGMYLSPDLPAQWGAKELEQKLQKADFSTPEQAWDQFVSENHLVIDDFSRQAQDPVIYRDAIGEKLYDIRGKGKVASLEDAVKAIVRRGKLKHWRDFPMEMIHELPDHDVLRVPQTVPPEIEQEMEIYAEMDRYRGEMIDRFKLLRAAREILEYSAPTIGGAEYEGLLNWLLSYLTQQQNFTLEDFQTFQGMLESAQYASKETTQESIPF